jgi:carbonic anhydrase/acetyltransferase-like protein (isoleucine patch superfamily)
MIIEYKGKTPTVHPSAFVAPTAVLIGDVEVGEEASIWFGTVVRGDNGPIRIGARANVQDNAVLHVSENNKTIIGEDVTIGHCAVLEDCTIERGALIGTNATVLNGATVGARSLIAAGSVVAAGANIPAETVAGPEYVHLSRSYLQHGIGDPEMHELASSAAVG